jgi:hypothetical protein
MMGVAANASLKITVIDAVIGCRQIFPNANPIQARLPKFRSRFVLANIRFHGAALTSIIMVPRRPGETNDRENDASSDSAEDDSQSVSSTSEPMDEGVDGQANLEPEYHTEESDNDPDEEETGSEHEAPNTTAPLLPKELLKPLPSPAYSRQQSVVIPREQMTRQQKVMQRNRDRKAKKRVWDRLRQDTQGTGVFEAGKFAQLKRGIAPRKDRVKSGRVTKKSVVMPHVSGRQRLLEQRKRAVEQNKSELLRPQGQGRRRGKRASAG